METAAESGPGADWAGISNLGYDTRVRCGGHIGSDHWMRRGFPGWQSALRFYHFGRFAEDIRSVTVFAGSLVGRTKECVKLRTLRLTAVDLLLLLLASVQVAVAEEKSVEDQVKEIVSSERGTVRKWTFPPEVVVIFRDDANKTTIENTLEQISKEVASFPGFVSTDYFDLRQIGPSAVGQTSIRPVVDDSEGAERISAEITFKFHDGELLVKSNIFIYFTSLEEGIMFGVLSSGGTVNKSLRGFAEGETPCYFNLLSKDDRIHIANIFIRNDTDLEVVAECIYEEVTQSMGLLEDSPGSSMFSFDNRSTVKSDRSLDFVLLRSLYDHSVRPGDSPNKVLAVFLHEYNETPN
jgi:Protein of unknown function (DUF2927)